MSDLDKKLEELLSAFIISGNEFDNAALQKLHDDLGRPHSGEAITAGTTKQMVTQAIKQAFIDEGWVKLRNHEQGEKCFTGQEWYDKFEYDYRSVTPDKPLADAETTAFWAAKKVSGIES
jgi:hypothetical protein